MRTRTETVGDPRARLAAVAVVLGLAVIACGSPATGAASRSYSPRAAAGTTAPAATEPALPTPSSSIDGEVNAIDQQLGAIDGELNQATTGINTNEGDPSK